MSFLFGGKQKTPAEMMKEYKRNVDRSVREIERERTKLQQQEKKVIADIKKAAKDGQMGPVKIMAKDLVRTRSQVTKFYQMKCQMQAVGLRLQTIKSTQAMTDAMKGAAKAMRSMNKAVNPVSKKPNAKTYSSISHLHLDLTAHQLTLNSMPALIMKTKPFIPKVTTRDNSLRPWSTQG
mmetsp:Transcript_9376/g.14766  ORF Transcript_9376/g.14766 Transcript_9376/m.14766 type:complete len:179 (+) Transcript_9376:69-605(+)